MTTLVLGRYRWRRRRTLARLGFAAIDPFGRPDYLFLTDSHRKRTILARSAAERHTFEPDTRVLGALFDDLWRRFGDGRALVPELTLVARCLPLVAAASELAHRGSALAVARRIVRLGLAERQMRLRVAVEPVVRTLVETVVRASDVDLPVPFAHELLSRRLRDPGPALQAWLAARPPVVVDDLLQPAPLAADVLLTLVGALEAAGTPTALSFQCGHDAGPSAVAELFGAGERSPWAQRDLAASAGWRRAVFERVVATGRARIVFAMDDGPVDAADAVAEPPDAVDLWSAGQPAPLPDGVRVATFDRPAVEADAIAAEVSHRLEQGVPAHDLLVAVADPATYRSPLAHAFAVRGIAVDRSIGVPLGSSPVGQVVALALDSLVRDLDPMEWLALGGLLGVRAAAVRRGLAPAGIHRGPPGTWRGRLVGHARRSDLPVGPLLEELAALEAIRLVGLPTIPRPFHAWWTDLRTALDARGLVDVTERSDALRRAGATLQRSLEEVAVELGETPLDVETVVELAGGRIDKALIVRPTEGGVPIVGVLELRGRIAPHTWVVGAARGSWPAAIAANPLCSVADARNLSPVDRLAEARHLTLNGIRDRIGEGNGSLVFTWSRSVAGRPTVPSRVIAELLETVGVEPERHSTGSLVPAASVHVARRGHLPSPPPRRARLGVTAAEMAMQCPARFWYHHVLRLRPEDPWDPELEPRRRGTALHRIFQEYYEDRDLRPVDAAERDAAAARLHGIAGRVLDEVEADGGFEPALQAWARGRWLAGLVDDAPLGILGAWLAAEIDRGIGPHAVEHPIRLALQGVELVGTVDRVDEVAGVVGVVDYKTGQAPSRERVERSLALQPLVYLAALAPDRTAASAYQLVGRPDSLRFAGWFGDKTAVDLLGGRRPVLADADERRERLEGVEHRLDSVAAGHIATTEWGPDLGGCTWCAFHRVCRVRHDQEPPC